MSVEGWMIAFQFTSRNGVKTDFPVHDVEMGVPRKDDYVELHTSDWAGRVTNVRWDYPKRIVYVKVRPDDY